MDSDRLVLGPALTSKNSCIPIPKNEMTVFFPVRCANKDFFLNFCPSFRILFDLVDQSELVKAEMVIEDEAKK